MLRKMKYKEDERRYLFYPYERYVEKGDVIEVNSKEEAENLEASGFEEEKETKKKTKEGE